MKRSIIFLALLLSTFILHAQVAYDSVTISRFLITDDTLQGNWRDTLKAGHYSNYLSVERTLWIKPDKYSKVSQKPIFLFDRIKENGTADVAKCFIPRHSVNFYRSGKIFRYLLVCFECDGVHFSDDPAKTFVKNIETRDKQMAELKILLKDIL